MATEWISPTWRMPNDKNQSKFENYSLDFISTNSERIILDNSVDLGLNSTISLWVNFDSTGSVVLGEDSYSSSYLIYVDGTNIYIRINAVALTFVHSMSTGQWYNIAIVRQGDSIEVFRNNTSLGTQTGYGTSVNTKFNVIGAKSDGTFPVNGKLSEVVGFDYALSESQRNYLYNSGTPINPMAISGQPPVAYYPLGGSSTGSASTLTIPNESVPSATVFDFVPSGDYINCGKEIGNTIGDNYTGGLTVSGWINPDTTSSDDGVFQFGNFTGYEMALVLNVSKFIFYNNGQKFAVSYTNPNNVWTHFALTFLPSGSVFYINGAVAANWTYTDLDLNNLDFIIGSYYSASYSLDGKASNFQIWNTSLLSSEVTTLYNNGVPLYTGTQPQAANLKAWYKLNVDTSTWNGSDWVISRSPFNYSKCLNFPNTSDNFIYNSFNFNGKPEVTFSFWYNNHMTINVNDKILGTKDTTYWAFKATQNRSGLNGTVTLTIKTGDNVSSNTAAIIIPNVANADSGWNLFTGTYDGSNFRGYLNGVQVGSDQPITGNLMSSTGAGSRDLNITVRDGAGMAGIKISNFVIWDKGLTSPEVATLFNGGTPFLQKSDFPQQANMSLWNTLTDMNTSSGGGVFDKSGNGVVITNPTNPPVSFNLPVSTLNGTSSGMTTANLVNSDLTRSIPYSSYSMDFDGTADYIDCGAGFQYSDLTISGWFNANSISTFERIIQLGRSSGGIGFGVGWDNSSKLIAWWNDGTETVRIGNTSLSTSTWYHFAMTRDSSEVKIYVNGVDDSGTGGQTGWGSTNNNLELGRKAGGGQYMDGKLSNVSIFNSVLTQDQILTIYNGGVPNDISSLSPTGWWSLGGDSYYDGTNFILPDLSANSNNGTSGNMSGMELVGNGPSSSANGTATNMDIPANLKGDAPNSSSNAFSVNMNSQDRVADVPA